MTNADQGAELAREIVRSAANVYGWAELGTAHLAPVEIALETPRALAGPLSGARP